MAYLQLCKGGWVWEPEWVYVCVCLCLCLCLCVCMCTCVCVSLHVCACDSDSARERLHICMCEATHPNLRKEASKKECSNISCFHCSSNITCKPHNSESARARENDAHERLHARVCENMLVYLRKEASKMGCCKIGCSNTRRNEHKSDSVRLRKRDCMRVFVKGCIWIGGKGVRSANILQHTATHCNTLQHSARQ